MIDMSELDGCGLMLQTVAGEHLLPVNAKEYEWQVGDRLAVSYEAEDGMSTCMAEKQMVVLTCVQDLKSKKCDAIDHVGGVAWLEGILTSYHPVQIVRYQWRDLYLYEAVLEKGSRWYSCTGKLICEGTQNCGLDAFQLAEKLAIYMAHR